MSNSIRSLTNLNAALHRYNTMANHHNAERLPWQAWRAIGERLCSERVLSCVTGQNAVMVRDRENDALSIASFLRTQHEARVAKCVRAAMQA